MRLATLASQALSTPAAAEEAAADLLAATCLRQIAGGNVIPALELTGNDNTFLSVQWAHITYYPLFQFDGESYRQYPIIAELGPLLGADIDPAGAVSWWLTRNPWLSARPADLLGTEREAEIRYAADQLAHDSW
ncbi:MAG TPA: hypothetical protein VFQ44_03070 [Streptosporangiaceae bacterium]|nr:hypothetical protein [Streptosporangiaceae bacterium]